MTQAATDELGLAREQVLERGVESTVLLVVQVGVAMAERSAGAVLPAHADPGAFGRQAGKRQHLGCCPIERLFAPGHRGASIEQPFHLPMRREIVRDLAERLEQGR